MDHNHIAGDSEGGGEDKAQGEGDFNFQKKGKSQEKEQRREDEPEDIQRKGPDGLGVLCLDVNPEDRKKRREREGGQ